MASEQYSHGFLVLDKPEGISSAKAVAEVKKLLKCKKIGHGGTLDPLASGILPLAINEATKAFDYVTAAAKEYRFTVTFGEERETGDREGGVTGISAVRPTAQQVQAVLPEFIGVIQQVPPVYSAIKINGERAYKRARQGEEVAMAARPVHIHALTLLDAGPPDAPMQSATFTVRCGKGTYIRSLACDIARKLNGLGYVSLLRRTSVGPFHEKNAISLDKLALDVHNAALNKAWVPIELALDDIPAINMDAEQTRRLRHGQSLGTDSPDGKYMALHQGRIVALVECMQGVLKASRVFNSF